MCSAAYRNLTALCAEEYNYFLTVVFLCQPIKIPISIKLILRTKAVEDLHHTDKLTTRTRLTYGYLFIFLYSFLFKWMYVCMCACVRVRACVRAYLPPHFVLVTLSPLVLVPFSPFVALASISVYQSPSPTCTSTPLPFVLVSFCPLY